MNDCFVILTGSKNNAGDFLIKHRAKELFKSIRPDRKIIDFNAWESLDSQKLSIVNNSKALILTGGPSLQKNMYPKIYSLTDQLGDIKVPIITMGIGWKSIRGDWDDTYSYPLSDKTIALLERIKRDGFTSSVRDFQTARVLSLKGFDNFAMTGCPAYYDLNQINQPFILPTKIKKIAFSLGVSFIRSISMEKLMKKQILAIKSYFPDASLEVTFHHSLSADIFLQSHSAKSEHLDKHKQFERWLKDNDISYIDISGSATKLIQYYSNIDLHIGYRVHAHIFMHSVSKLSVLISEDGRAKGSKSAIGGLVIDGYLNYKSNIMLNLSNKFIKFYDPYLPNHNSISELFFLLENEIKNNGQKSKIAKDAVRENFERMKLFLNNLP